MTERKPANIGNCAVCGKPDAKGYVVASAFGPCSNAICLDCLIQGKEVYEQMVAYIAIAGRWPDDVNEFYQREVRRQLKLHNKTEEEFAKDVDCVIAFRQDSCPETSYTEESYSDCDFEF
jgi:hypothetical protein